MTRVSRESQSNRDPNSRRPGPVPWRVLSSEPGPEMPLFQVRFDQVVNPRNSVRRRAVVLESPDWCSVVALTSDDMLVLVRQYRFGTGAVTLEIPGGSVMEGEDHRHAAQRELLEETGYTSPDWVYLGAHEPNPAVHNNLVHHWFARGCTQTHDPSPSLGEDIRVETIPLARLKQAALEGEIRSALVVAALSRVVDLRMDL